MASDASTSPYETAETSRETEVEEGSTKGDELMPKNVCDIGCATVLDLPAERILNAAIKKDLREVLIIGWDKDGGLYAASSIGEIAENLLLCEMFKHRLISGDFR